ncbi:hypothetical protein JQX13_18225 [Archangium violaceum]|uniref:hypothetical protein n=1 Tax=Archangium violaceum TaxID=83451 RepID=UPI00193C0979|nr:hypothetical protein [Archangium violaceum]QRK11821.1 hypothetical protein JQX13_18225 [Archangium violaceum]
MSTSRSNAGQPVVSSQDAVRDSESTRLSAGYRASVSLVLVPRTAITFHEMDSSAVSNLASPSELLIDIPIRGQGKNFKPGDVPCGLTWLVTSAGKSASYPVDGAVMKVAQDGSFHVEVAGKTPVIDVVAHRLLGEGVVGFSLTPEFPHAETATFPPSLRFNNTCAIRTKLPKPDELLLGAIVTFSPDFGWTFKKAELELRVIEVDDGSTEIAAASPRSAFSHRWEAGSWWSGDRDWAIGFTDDTCEQLADVGEEEAGSYEFGWQLWGASRAGGPQTLLLEQREFLRIPKPKLEDFKVDHDRTWEGTWEVSGKMTGVAPRAHLMLDVALVEPGAAAGSEPPDYRAAQVRLALQEDGSFEGHLGERHWPWTADPLAPAEPTPPVPLVAPPSGPQAFAILSLPAAARDGKPGPMAAYLDFDEDKFSAFKGQALSWDPDADWVCSEEGVTLMQRPPKPKRRKSGLTTSPAPPVEAGDQKTAITFDEMWLDITAWEGVVAYMYRDTEGHVTVGAGNLLSRLEKTSPNDKLAAKGLPFMNMDTGKPATDAEIEKAFRGVMELPKAMRATEYALRPTIALTDQTIRALAKERLEGEFLPHLRRYFPDFDRYPRAARRGLLDIVYNVGVGKFPGKANKPGKEFLFDNLTKAARARNWAVAAENCHTSGTPENRNAWRKALFLHAVTVEAKKA